MWYSEHILFVCIAIVLIGRSSAITCARCQGAYSTLSCYETEICPGSCFMTVHSSPRSNGDVYTGGCAYEEQCEHTARRRLLLDSDTDVLQTRCCNSKNRCNLGLKFEPVSTTFAPLQLSDGLLCHVCSGPTCGLYEDDPTMKCTPDFPYCRNTIQNDSKGNKLITKRCARYDECKTRVQQSECLNFDPSKIYTTVMDCTICCQTSFCNSHVVPPQETIVQ